MVLATYSWRNRQANKIYRKHWNYVVIGQGLSKKLPKRSKTSRYKNTALDNAQSVYIESQFAFTYVQCIYKKVSS